MADQIQRLPSLAAPRTLAGAVCWLTLFTLLCTFGCAEPIVPDDDEGEKLRQLTILYAQYAATNGDTGPADEATFKQFISQRPDKLDIDAMFVSKRDNRPYVILYGKKLKMSFEQNAPPDVVIYEEVGVGGRRYLGAADGEIGIVDEEKFKELVPE